MWWHRFAGVLCRCLVPVGSYLVLLQGAGRVRGLMERAARDWKNALVDLGGRNNLLHYRDLKLGTVDLTGADPGGVGGLLLGKTVRVSALFTDPALREQVLRRVRTVHNKAKENF